LAIRPWNGPSAPVKIATTPDDFNAADVSILSIVACACGERRKNA
jgi:hypothetical protein